MNVGSGMVISRPLCAVRWREIKFHRFVFESIYYYPLCCSREEVRTTYGA